MYFSHGHSRCLANGNYDPIQCVDVSGNAERCLCVLPWSDGNYLEPNGTFAFPETITDLHCFDEILHDVEYYRPCEKKIHELEVRKLNFALLALSDGMAIFDRELRSNVLKEVCSCCCLFFLAL